MGRFYESTAGTFLDDKMFQAPHQLMAQAIQAKDAVADKATVEAQALNELIAIKAHEADSPRARQIMNEEAQAVMELTQNIAKNPLDYANYNRQLIALGRKIKDNHTVGEAANMNANKILYDKKSAEIDALNEKEGYSASYKKRAKQLLDEDYIAKGGAKWNPDLVKGENKIGVQDAYYALNFDKSFLDKMKATGRDIYQDVASGAWIEGRGSSSKKLTPADIQAAYLAAVKADPDYQTALNKYKEMGVDGYANQSVGVDDVYLTVKDKNGKEHQILNPANIHAKNMLSAGMTYKQDETTSKKTLSINQVYENDYSRAYEEAKTKRELMATPVTEALARTEEQIREINKEHRKILGGLGASVGLSGVVTPALVEKRINSLEKLANTPEKKKVIAQYRQRLKLSNDTWRGNMTQAGYAPFGLAYGTNSAISAQKQVDALTKADARNVYDKKMDFTFKNANGEPVLYKDKTFYDVYNSPEKYGLDENAFKLPDPKNSKKFIRRPIKDFYVQNSAMPIMISGTNWNLNDMVLHFEVDGQDIQGQTSFENLGIKQTEN